MAGAYANTNRRVLGIVLAVALACGLCPAAAFAGAGSLTAASTLGVQPSGIVALTAQAAKAKSAKKTTKKSAAFSLKKHTKAKGYAMVWYIKPTVKGSSGVAKKINKS